MLDTPEELEMVLDSVDTDVTEGSHDGVKRVGTLVADDIDGSRSGSGDGVGGIV